MTDTEKEALCERIDELCAELYKLRRTRDELDFQINDNWRLTAENETLREYAARAWRLLVEHGAVNASELSEVAL